MFSMSKIVPFAFDEQKWVRIRDAKDGIPKLFNTASCRGTNMFIANDFIVTTVL